MVNVNLDLVAWREFFSVNVTYSSQYGAVGVQIYKSGDSRMSSLKAI